MLDPFGTAADRFRLPATGPTDDMHPGWPESTPFVRLPASAVFPSGARMRLRPLLRSDGHEWRRQRIEDESFLRSVEPTQAAPVSYTHLTLPTILRV